MSEIGIGIIGGGYMGKAHAVAMSAVGPLFGTALRPRVEMVAASSDASAARYAADFGFARSTGDWQELVADPAVDAVVIASPPETHLEITRAVAAVVAPRGNIPTDVSVITCETTVLANLENEHFRSL